jgi:crotonobetainyl-CoA:carnitine CoA-transferase CaiB-like acyl-CoA transferase
MAVDALESTQPVDPYLQGIRVLDASGALAGPFCTAILSDLGAEIIRVEPPRGDGLRRRGRNDGGPSIPYEMVHRNKSCIAVDMTTPEGQDAIVAVAQTCDALVQNFRPGVMEKYGLGPERFERDVPHLVYCSISGFGGTGPRAGEGMVDLVAQGYGGLMGVTGSEDGEIAKAGYPVSDLGAGMWAVIGVLAGIVRRARTGRGGAVDVSMVDGIASWSVWELADYQMTGEVPKPLGTAHRLAAPYQAFRCKDGRWVTVAAVERQWPLFCDVVQIPGLTGDERFATEWTRYVNRRDLAKLLATRFLDRPRDEWIADMSPLGIPCGPVLDLEEMLSEQQFVERGTFTRLTVGDREVVYVNTPIMGDGATRVQRPAPALGEATRRVLLEAGYTNEAIDDLVELKVLKESSE